MFPATDDEPPDKASVIWSTPDDSNALKLINVCVRGDEHVCLFFFKTIVNFICSF